LGTVDLTDILCFEYERTVGNDYAARFECRLFQIRKTNKPFPLAKDKVVARIRLDGSLSILRKGKTLLVEELKTAKKDQSSPHAA
jgi:hypothetical protein